MQWGSATLSYLVLFPRNIRLLPRAISRNFRGFNIGLAGWGLKLRQSVWLAKCCKIQQPAHFICTTRYIYIQHYTFVLNNAHFLSTSTKSIFIQQKYSFNLNQNYFCSTSPELFSLNNNNYSTSKMQCKLITYLFYDNGFDNGFRTFRISSVT